MIIGGNQGGNASRSPGAAAGPSEIVPVSEREFEAEVLRSDTPVLLFFASERSEQCRVIVPEVDAFARENKGKVKAVKIDIDRSPAIAQQLRVQQVPMFMLFAEGRIVDAKVGPLRKKQLAQMAEPYLPRDEGSLKALELAQLLPKGVVVPIDTRDAAAYARAHLPGAIHMPLEEIESRIAELYMVSGRPVFYCRSGDKSKELAAKLTEMEVPVAYLEGGLLAWETEGLKVQRS